MSLGEKIVKLRRENNYTQEQLAEILNVSRQSVSKWESDLAYPETDKLIKISELFNCSLDYLLKDVDCNDKKNNDSNFNFMNLKFQERKSKKTFKGLPIYHIGKNAKGVIAIGLNAKGVIALGFKATGLISFGMLSVGIFSFGFLSIGILAIGLLALALISVGCFSFGLLALGSISFGIVSLGAIAIGDFSIGALAIGKYFAYGDNARAMIAIGFTKTSGTFYESLGNLSSHDIIEVKDCLDLVVPNYFNFIKEIIKFFLR